MTSKIPDEGLTAAVMAHFKDRHGMELSPGFPVSVGFPPYSASHAFDLGIRTGEMKLIVTCRDHTFKKTGSIPSDRLREWREEMFTFHLAPEAYKKVFVCRYDARDKGGHTESLAEYFVRHNRHLIPVGVEIWEFDTQKKDVVRVLTRLSCQN